MHHSISTDLPYPEFSLRSMYTPLEKMEKAVQDFETLANEIQKNARSKVKISDPWFRDAAFHGPLGSSSFKTTLEKEL